MRTTVHALVVLLAACSGGNKNAPSDATPDTPPDMPPDSPPPNVVQVDLFDVPPIFIAYREGNGPWLVPEATSNGYEMRIDKQYELVSVCGDATNGFDIGIEAATFAEIGGETFVPCFSTTPFAREPVSVKGTMVQPGTVTVDIFNLASSTTPNWSFELFAEAGTKDFVAAGTNNRVVVLRDVDAQAATTLPKIDVVNDPTSVALGNLALTVNGILAGDTISTRTRLTTKNFTFANISRVTNTTAKIAPDSFLQNGDRQNITVSAINGDSFRSVFFRHSATSPTTLDLLAPLGGVTFADQSATWTDAPTGDIELDIETATTFTHMFATRGFIGSAKQIVETTDIPGFQPEWKPTNPDFRALEVFDFVGAVNRISEISQVLGGFTSGVTERAAERRERRELARQRKIGPQGLSSP